MSLRNSPRRYDVPLFLVVIFSGLRPDFRLSFTRLLDGQAMDKAINEMLKGNFFPSWIDECFSFDSLYGRVNGLREALSMASRDLLIRTDGSRYDYHLVDFEQEEIKKMTVRVGLKEKELSVIVKELNDRIGAALATSAR